MLKDIWDAVCSGEVAQEEAQLLARYDAAKRQTGQSPRTKEAVTTEFRRVILGVLCMAFSLTLPHVWMQVSQFLLGALLTGVGVYDWIAKQKEATK